MLVHVRRGKGHKDRLVPLPTKTLGLLRSYWATHRNPQRIFPSEGRDHKQAPASDRPMEETTWGRDCCYHLHVHVIVPGGALSDDGSTWLPSRADFLVSVKAASVLYRAKFKEAMRRSIDELSNGV